MQAMAVSLRVKLSQDDGVIGGFSNYTENMRKSQVSLQRSCVSYRSLSRPTVMKGKPKHFKKTKKRSTVFWHVSPKQHLA